MLDIQKNFAIVDVRHTDNGFVMTMHGQATFNGQSIRAAGSDELDVVVHYDDNNPADWYVDNTVPYYIGDNNATVDALPEEVQEWFGSEQTAYLLDIVINGQPAGV